jgi:two-component system, LytTR family, response regulator
MLSVGQLGAVKAGQPQINGECFLVLESGSQVKVSRSYRDVVARFVH